MNRLVDRSPRRSMGCGRRERDIQTEYFPKNGLRRGDDRFLARSNRLSPPKPLGFSETTRQMAVPHSNLRFDVTPISPRPARPEHAPACSSHLQRGGTSQWSTSILCPRLAACAIVTRPGTSPRTMDLLEKLVGEGTGGLILCGALLVLGTCVLPMCAGMRVPRQGGEKCRPDEPHESEYRGEGSLPAPLCCSGSSYKVCMYLELQQ